MVSISTLVGSLRLESPLVLASGVLGVSPHTMIHLSSLGIGAVTTKSVGPRERKGNENPSVVSLGNGTLLNAVGLANPGIEEFEEDIRTLKEGAKCPVIVSVFGSTNEEYLHVAQRAADAGADVVELNVSCPHAEVSAIGVSPEHTEKLTGLITEHLENPVWVKLSPNVTDIAEIGKAAERGGASAVVAINTIRGMAIDTNTGHPLLSNITGGVSGAAIKPMGVYAVYSLYKSLKIPIVGLGGVYTAEDVVEYMMAGASAVGIGSAFINGMFIVKKINAGLKRYLREHNMSEISELIGKAHKIIGGNS